MAITAITPITLSLIEPGDSFAFTVDDTYTTMQIEVDTTGGVEYAYDSGLGGAQAGYTVSVVDNGGTHTFTVARDSGWDESPQNIRVIEDETGSSATTSFSYYLTTTAVYPQGSNPYSSSSQGTGSLTVTEDDVQVRDDVGQMDFDDATFDVSDLGNGKVRVVGTASGAGDLDAVINASIPDNAVDVPNSDPVILSDGGTAGTTPVSAVKTAASATVPTLSVNAADASSIGIQVKGSGTAGWDINSNEIKPTDGTAASTIGEGTGTGNGGSIFLQGNATTNAGSFGGNIIVRGGESTTGTAGDVLLDGGDSASGTDGKVRIADVRASEVLFGQGFTVNEEADHPVAPAAGKGQFWVRDDSPCVPVFTDDTGTDTVLGAGGGADLDATINAAVPDNTVVVPTANPVIFQRGSGIVPLTIDVDDAFSGDGIEVSQGATLSKGVGVTSTDEAVRVLPNGVFFTVAATPGANYFIKCGDQAAAGVGDDIFIEAGGSDTTNGDVYVDGGQNNTGAGGNLFLGIRGFPQSEIHVGPDADFSSGFTITESADHPRTPAAGEGQIWTLNNTPNDLMFTDDDGNDFNISSPINKYAWDGSLKEIVDVDVTSNGTVITLSVQASGGGDLTAIFDNTEIAWDTTPADTVSLTAGTDAIPQLNYVYATESGGTITLVTSTTSFPAEPFAPIATVYCQSAATLQTDGAMKVHVWTDHVGSSGTNGHISHINKRLRSLNASWQTGVAPGDMTTSSPDAYLSAASGTVMQLHEHAFPALDMSGGDQAYLVNDPTTAFKRITTLDDVTQDAAGGSINNKHFKVVLWGAVNEDSADCKLYINLPVGTYNNPSDAEVDAQGYTVYSIPSEYTGVGFLIAEYNLQGKTSGLWVQNSKTDLRGLFPSTSPGGGGGGAGSGPGPNYAFKYTQISDGTGNPASGQFRVHTGTSGTPSGITKFRFHPNTDLDGLTDTNIKKAVGIGNYARIWKDSDPTEWYVYECTAAQNPTAGSWDFNVSHLGDSGGTFDQANDWNFHIFSGQNVQVVSSTHTYDVSFAANFNWHTYDLATAHGGTGFARDLGSTVIGTGIDARWGGFMASAPGELLSMMVSGYAPTGSATNVVFRGVRAATTTGATTTTNSDTTGFDFPITFTTSNAWYGTGTELILSNKTMAQGDMFGFCARRTAAGSPTSIRITVTYKMLTGV